MKVGIGSDAKGFRLKHRLMEVLADNGYDVEDVGCYSLERVDYPDFARLVGEGVAGGAYERGILICGTGQGMGIAANKVQGVRAAVCYDMFTAILSRDHNDANVFCTGAWIIDHDKAGEIVLQWLEMGYSGVHGSKIEKIAGIESRSA